MLKIFRFFAIGGILTISEWVGFYGLVYWFHIHYIIASLIMFVLMSFIGIFAYKKFVFQDCNRSLSQEIVRTYIINIVGVLIGTLFLFIVVDIFKIEAMWGKILTSFIMAFYGYFGRKIWIYGAKIED